MPVLVPLYSHGITFTEVPEKVAVYFEMGGCYQRCSNCHSKHLQEHTAFTRLSWIKEIAKDYINKGANAICLMGGTTHPLNWDELEITINELSELAPVCLYSGSTKTQKDLSLFKTTNLTYLKTGAYKENLGGLDKPNTNQRFYKKYPLDKNRYKIVDLTHKFQKPKGE